MMQGRSLSSEDRTFSYTASAAVRAPIALLLGAVLILVPVAVALADDSLSEPLEQGASSLGDPKLDDVGLGDVALDDAGLDDAGLEDHGLEDQRVDDAGPLHPTSVARDWTEAALYAIRKDLARPTVHARNLHHLSAAMYDAWAVFNPRSNLLFLSATAKALPSIAHTLP